MKNSIFLIAIGLIVLTGCSKDESFEQNELKSNDSIYVLEQIDGSTSWDAMPIKHLQPLTDITYPNNDGKLSHTDGYYMPTARDAMTIKWSGTQDGNGVRGSAELKQSTPNYSFHFILETECVTVDGDRAVYGGTITEVKAISGDVPSIGFGWRFYFNVIDAGQGADSYDQIANTTFFASPSSPSLCGVYLPNDRMWTSQGYTEVRRPGFVVVYN